MGLLTYILLIRIVQTGVNLAVALGSLEGFIAEVSKLPDNIALGLAFNFSSEVIIIFALLGESVADRVFSMVEAILIRFDFKPRPMPRSDTEFWKKAALLFGFTIICVLALNYVNLVT